MKNTVLVLVAILTAVPAMADVTIRATTDGEASGVFRIQYEATGDDAAGGGVYSLISGMAINVSITAGTMDIVPGSYKGDGESTNASPGYGIYPGSIQFDANKQVTSYGDPPAPSGDPGSLGDLPGSGCTIEAGALYDDDASPSAQPLATGIICKFEVSEDCHVDLAVEDIHRKGIVMEDGSAPSNTVLVECDITGLGGPECWSYLTQCYADSNGDGNVDTIDFGDFRDSWGKTYPDADYNPCADYNRDGTVDTVDFGAFRDNWGATGLPQDCPTGGTWPPV
jgi:hypothetical protein